MCSAVVRELSAPPRALDFGFAAHYEIPNPDPTSGDPRCGTGLWGPERVAWNGGPHADFDELDVRRLARESLEWFEASPMAGEWQKHGNARLELKYPSGVREITVRQDRRHSWEDQLRAWFERFPPSSDSERSWRDEDRFPWGLDFGDLGEVNGHARSPEAAIDSMRQIASELERHAMLQQPQFRLAQLVQRTPRSMDCYSVDTHRADELDDLPRRLQQTREGDLLRAGASND